MTLVYVIRRESFNNIVRWLEEVKEHCNSEVSVVLIGNKCDLEDE
jgi:GTPase SAR1 family protein